MQKLQKYLLIFVISCIAGVLTTNNIYVSNIDDIRFGIDDIYKILLQSFVILTILSMYYRQISMGMLFMGMSGFLLWAIRSRFLITEKEYIKSMIPKHSASVFISQKMLEVPNQIQGFLNNTIYSQVSEIELMKQIEKH